VQKLERFVVFALLLLATGAGQSFFGDATRSSTSDGQPALQAAFGLLYLAIFAMLVTRFRTAALDAIKRDKWTLVLCLWAMSSALWSADPGESFRRSLGLLGTSMAGLFVGLRYEPRQQLKIISWVIGIGAAASLIVCLVAPGIGITSDGAWGGIYLIKNTLGRMMALGALCFALLALGERRHRAVRIAFFLLCCALLVLSRSATAVVVTVLILAVMPLRRLIYLRTSRLLAAAAVLVPVVAGAVIWVVEYADEILLALGRTSSLSGRIPLWQLVWDEITQRPILGYGFTAFWNSWEGQRVSDTVAWDVAVPHAHNGFLEIWLGLGIIGLGMLLLSLGRNFALALRAARGHSDIEHSWPLLLLVFTLLYNLTENSMLGVNSMPWMAYACVSFWLARTAGEEAHAPALEPEPEPALSN